MGKKITGVLRNENGITTGIKFGGNSTFTPLETAIRMVKRGEVEGANVSTSSNKNEYIRSNPDGIKKNNLDNL